MDVGHVEEEGEGQEQDGEQTSLLRLYDPPYPEPPDPDPVHPLHLSRGIHTLHLLCKFAASLYWGIFLIRCCSRMFFFS